MKSRGERDTCQVSRVRYHVSGETTLIREERKEEEKEREEERFLIYFSLFLVVFAPFVVQLLALHGKLSP